MRRREFLRAAGGLGAAALLAGRGARAWAAGERKRVTIGGRAARVVDIHAHCIAPRLAEVLPEAAPPRAVLPGLTLGPERLEVMDARGIDVQALSINQFWWYTKSRELAQRIVSLHDETLAAWCRAHPDRFVALTSVALQYPDLAADQLEHAVETLGHRGASIGGDVNGEPPTSAKFDPFWAKAEALGVPVFMHPNNAEHIVQPGALGGRGDLGNIIGNPLETTVFLSHMIFEGTLDRFPKLKVCAAHGGGFLPSYLGRSDYACERRGAACANRRAPHEYFKDQILVDSMVFSAEGLRHLVAETAPSQVVYGSDLPYEWPDTIDLIAEAPSLGDAEKIAILGGNLISLLKIPAA
ncbi:MAG TPA: amidohydrolase family protein [Gammaproteobacteria bacterium]|nr:amidohydrolase family protein [Gammaproteobacteria bacterium]